MDVQLIRYPEAEGLTARDAGCDLRFWDASLVAMDACRDVGDVFVGTRGFSRGCEEEHVMAEVRQAACSVGANAVIVRVLNESARACRQVRARLLSCTVDPREGNT